MSIRMPIAEVYRTSSVDDALAFLAEHPARGRWPAARTCWWSCGRGGAVRLWASPAALRARTGAAART